MKSFKFLLQESGASLIQIIIGAGLFAAMFMGVVNLLNEQAQTSKASTLEFEMVYLTDEIKSLMADPEICAATLEGSNPFSGHIDAISQKSEDSKVIKSYQTIKSNPESFYGQDNLAITNYKISDSANEVNAQAGTTELIVTYANKAGEELTPKRRLKLYISLDDKARIKTCYGPAGLAQKSPIYESQLWKPSSIREGLYLTKAPLVLGGQKIDLKSKLASSQLPEAAVIHYGAFQLKGSPESETCDERKIGALRYNTNLRRLQYCPKSLRWSDFPSPSFDSRKKQKFSVQLSREGRQNIGEFGYCTLTISQASNAQCSLTRSLSGNWLLSAMGENKAKCEATCYP